MGAVPNVLQLLVVLRTETVRLEQVVEFAVVAAMEGDGDPGSENRLAASAAAQFRRGERPQKSRQALLQEMRQNANKNTINRNNTLK